LGVVSDTTGANDMTEAAIRERLTGVFRRVFRDEALVLDEAMGDWDSIIYMNLLAAVEEAFQVRFATREVHRLSNAGDFLAAISAKVGATALSGESRR
jgi:acyl carrier protein